MTNQEIFDRVYVHLLTQKAKAMDEHEDSCVYRSPDGLKCAVGCLIPDNRYTPELEGATMGMIDMGIDSSLDDNERSQARRLARILKSVGVDSDGVHLLTALQRCHDLHVPSEWKKRLAGIAKQWKLTIPAMPQVTHA